MSTVAGSDHRAVRDNYTARPMATRPFERTQLVLRATRGSIWVRPVALAAVDALGQLEKERAAIGHGEETLSKLAQHGCHVIGLGTSSSQQREPAFFGQPRTHGLNPGRVSGKAAI